MHTLHSELLLVAGHAIVVVVFGDEALGTNGLLAALTGEAGLMPTVALMLHLPGACKKTYRYRDGYVLMYVLHINFYIR